MFSHAHTWKFCSRTIDCSKPVIMGIVNVTPDSFSDGGRFFKTDDAIGLGLLLAKEGADILDIGGESTRPGSDPVTIDEERARVIPVIDGLKEAGIEIPISIDTRRLEVAEEAVKAGAEIVNDVSALRDSPDLAKFCAKKNLGLVLMHMLGMPKTMQEAPHYHDVIREVGSFLRQRLRFAMEAGIEEERIVLDPGIGFGKLLEHNLRILRDCHEFLSLGRPILIGPSRKRFIGELLDTKENERVAGTIGACAAAYMSGARIFRVHDVLPVRQALDVLHAVCNLKETRATK
jgi:dihydropteroate synthase